MKTPFAASVFLLVRCCTLAIPALAVRTPAPVSGDTSLYRILIDTRSELESTTKGFYLRSQKLDRQMAEVDQILEEALHAVRLRKQYLRAMVRKVRLLDERQLLNESYQLSLTETRYRKGLELIKLLYEKILGLDHHFTSMQTYQHVMMLSNPNTFPEFQQTKRLLEERLKKKTALKLPSLLEANPFLSAAFSLVASVVGDAAPAQKEKDLEQIACILDFTVRMGNDLNIIYYETEFLKENNQSLKEDCMALFSDYVKPIGYMVPLDICRKKDDWEAVSDAMEAYSIRLSAAMIQTSESARRDVYKYQTDLEFSVDRLLDFINKYAAFIGQGVKYYQKFQVIVGNYANEKTCASNLPRQFSELKSDIGVSIGKFNESYNIAELKGSKLKDLLYGSLE